MHRLPVLRIVVLAATALGLTCRGPAAGAAAPPNDDLAGAVVIGSLPFEHRADIQGAGVEPDERLSECSGSTNVSVWYRFTATTDARIVLDTRGSGFDTVLSVWTGQAHPLTEVACSDDSGTTPEGETDLSSEVRLTVPAGVTVHVRIDGYFDTPTTAWDLVLNATTGAGGAVNDDLASATPISVLPFVDRIDLQAAGIEVGEASASCAGRLPRGAWFRYVSPADTRVRFDVAGTAFNVALSVWVGDRHPLQEVSCAVLEPGPDVTGSLALHLAAGVPYLVKIEGWLLDLEGPTAEVTVHASRVTAEPPGDDLADAVAIAAVPFEHRQDVGDATAEPSEAAPDCHSLVHHAVWYRYRPEADGRVRFGIAGSAYGMGLSVWKGERHPLQIVACLGIGLETTDLSVNVRADTTYYVRAGALRTDRGALVLRASLPPPGPRNDDLDSALAVDPLPFRDETDTTEAGVEPDEAPSICGDDGDHGVWYVVSPTRDTRVLIETTYSDYAAAVSVWTGDAHPLTEVACGSTPEGSDERPQVAVDLTGGVTYHVRGGGTAGATGHLVLGVFPQAPNDALADAVPVATVPFTHTVDTRLAVEDPGEVTAGCAEDPGGGVWYRFLAPVDGRLRVDTRGSTYDTVVSVWSGQSHPLTPLACEDNTGGGGPLSSLTIGVRAAASYAVKVEGVYGAAGELVVHADLVPAGPANDDLAGARRIGDLPTTDRVDTREAGWEPRELPAPCGHGPGHGVWYRYAPPADGRVRLDTAGTLFDTVLSVWSGQAHPLRDAACSADVGGGGPDSSLTLSVAAGTVYLVKVEGSTSSGGALVLQASEPPAGPTNDDLEDALPVGGLSFDDVVDATDAGLEAYEEMPSCAPGSGRGVWYRTTARRDHRMALDARGSSARAVLSVWMGVRHPLRELFCLAPDARPATIELPVGSGETILVKVEPVAGETGRVGIAGRLVGLAGLTLPWAGAGAGR